MRFVSGALGFAVVATMIVVGCAKDDETAPRTSGVFAPAPRQQGSESPTPTATPADAARCEALGTLVGNGLEATLDSATARSVAVPLVSRPTATRVSVKGVGASADLSGKTIALGVAANVSNETCSHCLLIAVGCAGSDCSGATYYFPRSGTATFTSVASAAGQPFGGRFNDVILDQVTIDAATGATRTVADGRCLYVKDLAFDSVVPTSGETPPPTDTDGGSSSSSSGTVGSSSGGGGTEPGKGETDTSSGETGKGGGNGGGNSF